MDNLKITNNIVNWLNVIFNNEFLSFLELELLLEISLCSKLIRLKLRHILFNHLQLSYSNHNFKFNNNNIFAEYLSSINNYISPKSVTTHQNCHTIEDFLNEITSQLQAYKNDTNSFYIIGVEKAGYYLFPLINVFDSLLVLKLSKSTIPFTGFSKLSESLSGLKRMELVQVNFVKSYTDKISQDYFVLPSSLTHLAIYYCKTTKSSFLTNPDVLLFDKSSMIYINIFHLRECSISSLKKLEFFTNNTVDNGIDNFLELNSKLNSLAINFATINNDILNAIRDHKSLKCLEIEDRIGLDNITQIPTLEHITNLKLHYVRPDCYDEISKFCSSCPNLVELYFNIISYKTLQDSIDFIASILIELIYLKKLHLRILTKKFENIDFSKFVNLESLTLETTITAILNINFSTFTSIKEVAIKSNLSKINTKEYFDHFSGIENWKFHFGSHTIKGYKLLQ